MEMKYYLVTAQLLVIGFKVMCADLKNPYNTRQTSSQIVSQKLFRSFGRRDFSTE